MVENASVAFDVGAFVTHLHEMTMAIAIIWANNSKFIFLSNFDALKPRIIILRPEIYAPIFVRNDRSHDFDDHKFG